MYYWYYDIMIYVALSFALTQFNFVLVKQNVDRQSGKRVSLLGIEELQLHPSPGTRTWHRSPRRHGVVGQIYLVAPIKHHILQIQGHTAQLPVDSKPISKTTYVTYRGHPGVH